MMKDGVYFFLLDNSNTSHVNPKLTKFVQKSLSHLRAEKPLI